MATGFRNILWHLLASLSLGLWHAQQKRHILPGSGNESLWSWHASAWRMPVSQSLQQCHVWPGPALLNMADRQTWCMERRAAVTTVVIDILFLSSQSHSEQGQVLIDLHSRLYPLNSFLKRKLRTGPSRTENTTLPIIGHKHCIQCFPDIGKHWRGTLSCPIQYVVSQQINTRGELEPCTTLNRRQQHDLLMRVLGIKEPAAQLRSNITSPCEELTAHALIT